MSGTVSEPHRYPMIDVLRGFAALSVVVYHTIAHLNWTGFPMQGPLLWFRIGWLGVDLFFVISGFVIALAAFGLMDRMAPDKFRRTFMVHRLSRIVPLYYLTGILFVVMVTPAMMFQPGFGWQFVSHLLFVHNWSWITSGGIDGPNWSLGTEMQFYIFALLFAVPLRRAPVWAVAAVMVAIAWAWRAAAFHLVPIDPVTGPFKRFIYTSTQLPGTLDEFAFGIVLARFVYMPAGRDFLRFSNRNPLPAVAGAVFLVWLMLHFYWKDATYWDSAVMVVLFKSLIGLAAAGLVLAACCLNQPLVVRISAPLRYLGTISYGIYLWHLLVLQSLERVPGLSPARGLFVVILVTILLASASWHWFEQPIMRRFRTVSGEWFWRKAAARISPVHE